MRRVMVVAAYAGYPLLVGLIVALSSGQNRWAPLLALPLGLLVVLAYGVLGQSRLLGAAYDKDTGLDERQRELRGHAHTTAFRWFGLLTVLGVLYLMIATDLVGEGLPLPLPATFEHWYAVFWGALLLYGTLPTAVLAWNEPDLPE